MARCQFCELPGTIECQHCSQYTTESGKDGVLFCSQYHLGLHRDDGWNILVTKLQILSILLQTLASVFPSEWSIHRKRAKFL